MTTLPANHVDAALARHAKVIRALGRRVITDIIEIGRQLTEAKKIAGHGNWLPWLERELGWKERTAQRYINVFDAFGSNPSGLTGLELPMESLYLLAAPSTPADTRTEVIERAQAGEKLSGKDVQTIVDTKKGQQKRLAPQRGNGEIPPTLGGKAPPRSVLQDREFGLRVLQPTSKTTEPKPEPRVTEVTAPPTMPAQPDCRATQGMQGVAEEIRQHHSDAEIVELIGLLSVMTATI